MRDRGRVFILLLVMAVVAASVGGVAIGGLYNTSFEQQRARLLTTVRSQARLMEAVAIFHDTFFKDEYSGGAVAAAISQMTQAYASMAHGAHGETGEFSMARREGDQIVYFLVHGHDGITSRFPTPFASENSAPMRRALLGQSGSMIGIDSRGVEVLSVYEPVEVLEFGIVAKVDLAEIRAPFVRAGVGVSIIALVLIAAGTTIFLLVSNPVLRKTRESEERLRSVTQSASDAIISVDDQGLVISWNKSAERIFGYEETEMLDKSLAAIIPDRYRDSHTAGIERAKMDGPRTLIGRTVEIEGLRKDGSEFPIEISVSEWSAGGRKFFSGIVRDVTKRREAEGALRNSEAMLKSVMDNLPTPLHLKDREGRYLLVNKKYEEWHKVSLEELKGLTVFDFAEPEIAEAYSAFDKKAMENGVAQERELETRYPDGKTRATVGIKFPIRNAEGATVGVGGLAFDITERKRDEAELRKLSHALEQSPASVTITDADGDIEYVNPKTEQVTGYTADELFGRNSRILKTGYTSPEEYERLWQTITAGGVWRGEFRNRKKNGEIFWESASISPIKAPDGTITHFVAVKEDITTRKEAENALRESEERFRLVTDAVPVLMAYVDAERRFRFNNKAYEDWLGIPSDEMAGRYVSEVVGDDVYQPVSQYIDEVLSGKRVEFEAESTTVDGGRRVIEGIFIPHVDNDGDVAGYFSLITDVTERKREREEKVALERELQNASKLEAVGQLASGIAHEINTPTQYIGDNLRFLKEAYGDFETVLKAYRKLARSAGEAGVLEDEVAAAEAAVQEADLDYLLEEIPEATDQAIGGTEQVARIVLAMKEFSHPATKEKSAIDLNKAIQTTITVCRNEWKYVADLDTDLDPELPPVTCLAGEINQVFLNIIVNAAHAIETNPDVEKGRITVSTRRDNGHAVIRIADNGAGIPEDARDSVFVPFFTTKEVGKGTGQGLAIAHDIVVKKHGGEISFETETAKGTTFIIRLPIDVQDEATEQVE